MLAEAKEKTRQRASVPGTEGYDTSFLIGLQGRNEAGLYGSIMHVNLQKPVPFSGAGELIFRIEEISRFLNLLERDREFRSLRGGTAAKAFGLPEEYCKPVPLHQIMEHGLSREFYKVASREKLYLQLIGRQHMSLQGRIKGRPTGGEYVYFRSALELMYLLSELRLQQKH